MYIKLDFGFSSNSNRIYYLSVMSKVLWLVNIKIHLCTCCKKQHIQRSITFLFSPCSFSSSLLNPTSGKAFRVFAVIWKTPLKGPSNMATSHPENPLTVILQPAITFIPTVHISTLQPLALKVQHDLTAGIPSKCGHE